MYRKFLRPCALAASFTLLVPQADAAAPASAAPVTPAVPMAATPGAGAPASNATAPQSAIPYIQAVALSRWVLVALEQAKETGNYTVLSALGSSDFRSANPPEKLGQIFAAQRAYRTSKLITENPQFREVPAMPSPGHLTMVGFYIAGPFLERFRLSFTMENDDWRLSGLAVAIDQPQSQADTSATPSQTPKK